MTSFTDRARAEAEKRWHPTIGDGVNQPPFGPDDYIDTGMVDGFVLGAQWAAEQDPTEGEVDAAARALLDELGGAPDELESMHVEAAHAALLAARDVRKEQGR